MPDTELSQEQKKELGRKVSQFIIWLRGRLGYESVKIYDHIMFVSPDNRDWIMRVPRNNCDKNNPIKFNTNVLKNCSFDYYELIIIHECFHLLIQNIPDQDDVKHLRDDFNAALMIIADIEADYYTFVYLLECRNYKLEDIFALNYEGAVFSDKKVRFSKLERFISSALTIVNHYYRKPKEKEIFLISIKSVSIKDKLPALILKAKHLEIKSFNISKDASKNFTECFEKTNLSKEKYVKKIIKLCTETLNIKI